MIKIISNEEVKAVDEEEKWQILLLFIWIKLKLREKTSKNNKNQFIKRSSKQK